MRENAERKGARLLVSGRLIVTWLDATEARATCRGDSGEIYLLGYRPGSWYCDCPALGRCSHLVALMRVTVRPSVRRWQEAAW
jgi:uncharacterized Zn finger protein